MNRGYIRLWRKLLESILFLNEGLLKILIWCLLRANHKETFVQVKTGRGISEVKLMPGTFLFGRESAAKELHMSPSTVWKRILKLKKLDFLNIESNSHYSIIYIINWSIYQAIPENSNSESDRQVTGKEHRQELKNYKNKRTPIDFSEIQSLEERYSDRNLINQCFESISSTRKTNCISDSVKLNILHQWNKYPADQVMAAIRIYLEKDYAAQGKDEKYLMGIIRGNAQQKPAANIPGGKVMKRTGSMLDKIYQEQGFTLI
jgi:DNA-binding Lrp family transcriptional regulator